MTNYDSGEPDTAALDDPVLHSLRGHHAPLARRRGEAVTYMPGISTFAALETVSGSQRWDDLATLLGHGELADMFSSTQTPPPDWEPIFINRGRQLIHTGHRNRSSAPAKKGVIVELGAVDVPDMLALIERTRPGPFGPRTRELGTYLGVRDSGVLVAMAGERLRPPGWTEISAVCTAPEARGQGHAARLISALITRITARGEHPFLHVSGPNTAALALYNSLGFHTHQEVTFSGYRIP